MTAEKYCVLYRLRSPLHDRRAVEHVADFKRQFAQNDVVTGLLRAADDDILDVRALALLDDDPVGDVARILVPLLDQFEQVEDIAALVVEILDAQEIGVDDLPVHFAVGPMPDQVAKLFAGEYLVTLEQHAPVGVLLALDEVHGQRERAALLLRVESHFALYAVHAGVDVAMRRVVGLDNLLVFLQGGFAECAAFEQ